MIEALNNKNIKVKGISFDGDKASVSIFAKDFVIKIMKEYSGGKRLINIEKFCKKYDNLFPFCDPTHILKRIRTFIIKYNSVID